MRSSRDAPTSSLQGPSPPALGRCTSPATLDCPDIPYRNFTVTGTDPHRSTATTTASAAKNIEPCRVLTSDHS